MGNVMTELERNSKQQSNQPRVLHASTAEPSQTNQSTTPIKPPSESTWKAIVKDNSSVGARENPNKELLGKGVYWDNRKKKYWVDQKGNNCFMVFANGLKITWSDNPNYWYLQKKSELGDDNVIIAQLRNVAWLEVHGYFNIADLTEGMTYEVSFIVKLERTSYGWEVPVNFKLTLPYEDPSSGKQYRLHLKDLEKEKWFEIRAGTFKAPKDKQGDMKFSLYEYDGGSWKRGLIIKGAIIKPIIYAT